MASTSSNQTPSSSTSTSLPTSWDVFLSFRGTDTRYNITSHLYNALNSKSIKTFMDDPGLKRGEAISDALLQAIKDSKIYIVVLSENYVDSSWCLNELVEILACQKQMKRSVIPMFYHITPSVVRHQEALDETSDPDVVRQKEIMKKAFEKHQTRVDDEEKVKKWRSALVEVAGLSGYPISKYR